MGTPSEALETLKPSGQGARHSVSDGDTAIRSQKRAPNDTLSMELSQGQPAIPGPVNSQLPAVAAINAPRAETVATYPAAFSSIAVAASLLQGAGEPLASNGKLSDAQVVTPRQPSSWGKESAAELAFALRVTPQNTPTASPAAPLRPAPSGTSAPASRNTVGQTAQSPSSTIRGDTQSDSVQPVQGEKDVAPGLPTVRALSSGGGPLASPVLAPSPTRNANSSPVPWESVDLKPTSYAAGPSSTHVEFVREENAEVRQDTAQDGSGASSNRELYPISTVTTSGTPPNTNQILDRFDAPQDTPAGRRQTAAGEAPSEDVASRSQTYSQKDAPEKSQAPATPAAGSETTQTSPPQHHAVESQTKGSPASSVGLNNEQGSHGESGASRDDNASNPDLQKLPANPKDGLHHDSAGLAGVSPGPAIGATQLASRALSGMSNAAPPAPSPIETETNPSVRPQPIREISLKLADSSAQVDIQLAERAGHVQVTVRTPDQDLTKSLQTNLGDLVGRLEEKGYKAETWVPVAPLHAAGALTESAAGSGNNQNQGWHSGSGAEGQQQRQDEQDSGRRQQGQWRAQLEQMLDEEDSSTEAVRAEDR